MLTCHREADLESVLSGQRLLQRCTIKGKFRPKAIGTRIDAVVMTEHAAGIGWVIGQLHLINDDPVDRHSNIGGELAVGFGLRIVETIGAFRPVNALTAGACAGFKAKA